jgi:hypothetical protein
MEKKRVGFLVPDPAQIEEPVADVAIAGCNAPRPFPEKDQKGDQREKDAGQPGRPLLFEDGDVVFSRLLLEAAPKAHR